MNAHILNSNRFHSYDPDRYPCGRVPIGFDPVGRRGGLVVTCAWLRPADRGGDVPDRDGDDPVEIPGGELVPWDVFAESGDRVGVGLVVGPHVGIASRGIHAEP